MNFEVLNPNSSVELLETLQKLDGKPFRLGAGYTDLLLDIKRGNNEYLTVVNIANLKDEEFNTISSSGDVIRIGALVTANQLLHNDEIKNNLPVLYKSALELASPQIRQLATIGGNLCTASPAGDLACALMCLEAECEILSTKGTTRVVPLKEFIIDVRKTDLKKEEVLRRIIIPVINGELKVHSDFIKIGTRRSMECAVISLAYHILADKSNNIVKAGIAIGSAAPTIKFTESACAYLIDKNFSDLSISQREEFAKKVLEYCTPISDIRASAWYRKEVLYNICKTIFID